MGTCPMIILRVQILYGVDLVRYRYIMVVFLGVGCTSPTIHCQVWLLWLSDIGQT